MALGWGFLIIWFGPWAYSTTLGLDWHTHPLAAVLSICVWAMDARMAPREQRDLAPMLALIPGSNYGGCGASLEEPTLQRPGWMRPVLAVSISGAPLAAPPLESRQQQRRQYVFQDRPDMWK